MSCHYSCSSCISNTYYDICTACPSTRTLISTTCPCASGYYEFQTSNCIGQSQTGTLDYFMIITADICFYVAVGIQLLMIVFTMNRLISPKLKKIIDTLQVVGLVGYYRFLQGEVGARALKAINVFNFNYLSNFICDQQSPPYGCQTFQNLIGPALTLLLFILLLFLSYIIASCIYLANNNQDGIVYIKRGEQRRGKSSGSLSIGMYWQATKRSFILLYLDQTAIQTSIALSQIAISNVVGILVIIPFLVLIVIAGRIHFTTINNSKQTTLMYRAQHSYFFLYDRYYHLNYIDHLFEKDSLHQDRQNLKKAFYPQSNLMTMQILFKILLAISTIVFYEYSPNLFAFLCIFVLIVFACIMDHLFYYQRSTLFVYIICILVHIYAVSTFFIPSVFTYFIILFSVAGLVMAIVFMVMIAMEWKGNREGEMVNKIYQLQRLKQVGVDQSEEELTQHKQIQSQTVQIQNQGQPLQNNKSARNGTGNQSAFQRRTRQSMDRKGQGKEDQPVQKEAEVKKSMRDTRRSRQSRISQPQKEISQKEILPKVDQEQSQTLRVKPQQNVSQTARVKPQQNVSQTARVKPQQNVSKAPKSKRDSLNIFDIQQKSP